MEELLKGNKSTLAGIAYRKAFLERLQFLAQLATIDGALVLINELELVNFGATVKAKNGKVMLRWDRIVRA